MKTRIFLTLLVLPFMSQAEVISDLKLCSTIDNKDERLNCFDNLANDYTSLINAANIEKIPHLKKTSDSDKVVISKEAVFGMNKIEESHLESIKTRIEGKFNGWHRGAVINLANGQQWKVTNASPGYVKLLNPEVEISKGLFGSFDMRVKGLTAKAKVKRIK